MLVQAHLGLGDWSWEPTVVAGIVALAAGYAVAVRRGVISRDDDVSPWFRSASSRIACWAGGLACLWIALLSPIDTGGDQYLLSIHMVQHLLLMMVAPPLLLLGVAGVRTPPPDRHRALRELWRLLTRPWTATILFTAVLLVWHLPQLYNTTLTVEPLHVLEHLTFVAAGVVFWWPVVDPIRGPRTRPVTAMEKIAMLTLAGVVPTLLGFLFALASGAFYDFYVHAPRLWGLSPVADQQVAGVIMFGLGNVIYFVAISVIFLRMFGRPEDDEEAATA